MSDTIILELADDTGTSVIAYTDKPKTVWKKSYQKVSESPTCAFTVNEGIVIGTNYGVVYLNNEPVDTTVFDYFHLLNINDIDLLSNNSSITSIGSSSQNAPFSLDSICFGSQLGLIDLSTKEILNSSPILKLHNSSGLIALIKDKGSARLFNISTGKMAFEEIIPEHLLSQNIDLLGNRFLSSASKSICTIQEFEGINMVMPVAKYTGHSPNFNLLNDTVYVDDAEGSLYTLKGDKLYQRYKSTTDKMLTSFTVINNTPYYTLKKKEYSFLYSDFKKTPLLKTRGYLQILNQSIKK